MRGRPIPARRALRADAAAGSRAFRDPLLALRQGDAAPFEDFVRARARTLVAFFREQGALLHRAEDLTQEVFLRLYRGASRYEPRERFAAYCFRVARNVWIDDCRRAAARVGGEGDGGRAASLDEAGVRRDPAVRLLLEDEERGLRVRLASLPAGHRRVLELVLLGELSYAEIGALLAIPVGTVKSRMFHAVRRLRAAWSETRGEGVA